MIGRRRPVAHLAGCMALLLAAGLPGGASGQSSTARGSASAQVVAPLALSREADLDFGTLVIASDTAGSVTVVPQGGGVRYAGGASAVCTTACPAPHAARFTVNGEPGRSYRVSVPQRLSIVPLGQGAVGGVIVDSLRISAVSNPGDSAGVLSAAGSDQFEVGGTLQLPAQSLPGRYTTQVPVIVSYP